MNIATLAPAMDGAGVGQTTELYEGARHAHTMSDMGAYNEAAAQRHFKALFALTLARSLCALTLARSLCAIARDRHPRRVVPQRFNRTETRRA